MKEPEMFEISKVSDGVKVTLEYIGEGINGDFDADDPDDCPLLRFSVYANKKIKNPWSEDCGNENWNSMSDASYCTQISANAPIDIKKKVLNYIMSEVKPRVLSGDSIKKLCEGLSWIDGNKI